jgi:hypothetical protein
MPIEALRQYSEEFAVMFEWFNEKGYEADIPTLRKMYPELKTFETWVGETGWGKS